MTAAISLDMKLHRRWAGKGITCFHCGCQWRKGMQNRGGRCDQCGCWLMHIKEKPLMEDE